MKTDVNIGIVTTWFERGAAYVSKQFRDELCKQNSVYIYARGGEEKAIGDPLWDNKYVTWGKPTYSYVPTDVDLKDFRSWLLKFKINIVLFNEQKCWRPVLLCRELGILNGAYIDYYTEKTVPLFWVHDFLICNTRRHQSVFKKHPQCLYFPWGTDTTIFTPKTFEPAYKEMLTFFHSAGMSPYRKGTDLVVNAFIKHSNSARLVIHTQVNLSTVFPELQQEIKKLVDKGALIIKQETVPAPGLYHMGDVYLYPSRLDGIGLTILEAGACGLPTVVPDMPPMNEFIVSGLNGKLVDVDKVWSRWDGYYWPQNEIELSSLENVMGKYIDTFESISAQKKAAFEYANKHHCWTNNVDGLSAALSKMNILPDDIVTKAVELAISHDKAMMRRFPKSSKTKLLTLIRDKFPSIYNACHLLKNGFVKRISPENS